MSGMVSKSRIPVMRSSELPGDLQTAIISFKNALRNERTRPPDERNATVFRNGKPDERGRRHPGPSPLPRLDNGCCYCEFDVGRGHANRGRRRLVAEVVTTTWAIREIYFTDQHYTKGSFARLG
jgi:hypothetical protein